MKIMPYIRRTISLTALWSFIILTISSVIIYVQPHGRFTSWSGQEWFGMDRNQWFYIHINVGFLMIAACIIHILLNIKQINLYFRSKFRKINFVSVELVLSLLITAFVVWGTYADIKPITYINDLSWNLRRQIAEKYGRPPYANAEKSSLAIFCQQLGYNLEQAVKALNDEGFKQVDTEKSLLTIARENNSYPQEIYRTIHINSLPESTASPYNNSTNGLESAGRGQGGDGRGMRRRNRGSQQ